MKLETALYHAVHDFGLAKLAELMQLAESTLRNMANPRLASHEWTLKRIRQVIDFTGDQRVVHAFCAESGGMFLPLTPDGSMGDTDIFRQTTNVAKEFGDVVAEIQSSMADGSISQADRERIHQQIYEMNCAGHKLGMYVDSQVPGPAPTLSVVKR